MKIAISACLLGENVRFDGSNKKDNKLIELLKNHQIVSICPEVLSGFHVPRDMVEIRNNKVITKDNKDLTDILYKGSLKCFELIKDCDLVILKSKSPTCGYKKVYDGTFSNTLIDGNGIFTDICLKNNLKVYSEKEKEVLSEILL